MKNETKGSINNLLQPLAKHPFLSVIGMCVLLFFFGFCEKTSLTDFSRKYVKPERSSLCFPDGCIIDRGRIVFDAQLR